jgi:hypothetical protein
MSCPYETGTRPQMKRWSASIPRRYAVEFKQLLEKLENHLSNYLADHDDANAEEVAQAFVRDNHTLVIEFVAGLCRQRELFPRTQADAKAKTSYA